MKLHKRREKLNISISSVIKKKAVLLANTLGVSTSRLIEDALKVQMEKYGIRCEPAMEDISLEMAKLDRAEEQG